MFLNGVVIRVLELLRCSNVSYMEQLVLVLSFIRHAIIILVQQDIIILVQDIRIYPLISERLSD